MWPTATGSVLTSHLSPQFFLEQGDKIEWATMEIWFSVRIVNSLGKGLLPNSIKVCNCVLNDYQKASHHFSCRNHGVPQVLPLYNHKAGYCYWSSVKMWTWQYPDKLRWKTFKYEVIVSISEDFVARAVGLNSGATCFVYRWKRDLRVTFFPR